MTNNNQVQVDTLNNKDRKVLAEHFKGKQFNDRLVANFCTRNKIEIVDAGSVEDFIYQAEYDKRMTAVMPLVLAKIATMKYVGMFSSEEKKREILDFNDNLSAEIAVILEDNGIEYREIGFLKELYGNIGNIMNGAELRVSNMCATTLNEMALEKLGVDSLTIRDLSLERSRIADRKAKK